MVEPRRGIATVLFTDIVGSTERATALGDRGWRDVLRAHHAAVRRELRRHHGHEIATAGDGSGLNRRSLDHGRRDDRSHEAGA